MLQSADNDVKKCILGWHDNIRESGGQRRRRQSQIQNVFHHQIDESSLSTRNIRQNHHHQFRHQGDKLSIVMRQCDKQKCN